MQPGCHQHRRMIASSKVIRVGLCGGRGGSPWDDVDGNGRSVHGEKHGGGTDRSHSVKIDVDFPHEFLTGVSGCYGAAHGGSAAPPVVRSVTFATSLPAARRRPSLAFPASLYL